MSDLIDRQAAIDASCTCHGGVHCNHYPCKDVQAIMDLPTIEERKTGEWLFPYGDKKYKRCSVCERDYYSIPHNSNYCPNCGADMRGET